jgi:type I restriction enzyme S subunit
MDGLEVTELRLEELRILDKKFRIDSYFFSKQYFMFNKLLRKYEVIKLGDILETLTDYHANGSYEILKNHVIMSDKDDYAYMVRTSDLEASNFTKNVKYISEHAYNFLDKSKIYGGEILINKIGSAGKSYLMPHLNRPVSLGMNLFLLRLNKHYCPEFIYAYLQTKYGDLLIKREVSGAVPLSIDKNSVRNVIVPRLSNGFQLGIKNLFSLANQKLEKSRQEYQEAEHLLLDKLGLANFKPSNENILIRKLSDSFGKSGRIDSEYYQPKYTELLQVLGGNTNGCDRLEIFIRDYSTGYPYKSETYLEHVGMPLIRINNIGNGNLDMSNAAYIPDTDVLLSPNDVAVGGDILISMSGTIGNSCKIPAGIKAVINQRIMRITPNNYDSAALSLVINSVIGKTQLNQIGTGGVQTNISATDIKNIMVPILPGGVQNEIGNKLQDSFNLKQQSDELLNLAKHAIEVAIEQDEQTAMKIIGKVNNGEKNV